MADASVTIELGNAAMSTPDHVADALQDVALRLGLGELDGSIRDANGNTVGSFHCDELDDEEVG